MENADVGQVSKADLPIALKPEIASTHALGLQDLYKAAFSQEPTTGLNDFNHKTTAIEANLIQDPGEKFFVGSDEKIVEELEKPEVYKNSNFEESYQLYTLKGLQYAVDFVKPEDGTLDLNYDVGKEGALSTAVESAVVLNRAFEPSFQNDSNSVLDLDKGIQIHLVSSEEMGIPHGEQNDCTFEACEYTGDAQILHRYLCDTALVKSDGNETSNAVEATALNFMSKQNNNVADKSDSESVGVNPEILGVRFEDCDFNSSDSFASTESIIPKNIKCPKCPKKFMFKSDLLRHDKYKHSVKPKLFCKYCIKEFVSQQNLFFHEKSHKTKQNSYKCDSCKKVFTKSVGLVRHVINKHSKSVPFSCVKCDKFFTTQGLLKGHFRKVHLTEAEKPYKCDICPKSFEKRQGLNCHARAHLEDHPYVCQHCGKAFSRACYLKNHFKSHGGEEKDTFVCDACGKDFTSSKTLEEHSRKHTGEKPFTCNVCTKRFAYKACLKVHMKKHAQGKELKPYSCSQCQKTFVTTANLTKHERTHSKKAFQCTACGQEFAQAGQLKKHRCTPSKSKEVCTQTVEYVDGSLENVTLQNVNVIVDQAFGIQQPIVLTSVGSFIDSNSVPVILTQNPSGPYSVPSIT